MEIDSRGGKSLAKSYLRVVAERDGASQDLALSLLGRPASSSRQLCGKRTCVRARGVECNQNERNVFGDFVENTLGESGGSKMKRRCVKARNKINTARARNYG